MEGYLGEFPLPAVAAASFGRMSVADKAMIFVEKYGGIDGDHHKAWVLDQVSRILKGTPVLATEARWEGGLCEIRYHTGAPSKTYLSWVRSMCAGEDGPETYAYDEGIAP